MNELYHIFVGVVIVGTPKNAILEMNSPRAMVFMIV
jgi:hypothetical protein